MKAKLIFTFIVLIAFGCSPYKWTDRRNLLLKDEYCSDTVVLQDFVFCSVLRQELKFSFQKKRDLPYPEHSIINAIEERFFVNNLKFKSEKLKILEGQNKCDTIFRSLRAFRMNEEIKQAMLEISKNNQGKTQLIPYIFFEETFKIRYGYIGNIFNPGGMTNRSIQVAMIIVENNEIVYIKTDQHFGKSHYVESREEVAPILDFSILQELIASTLEDYFERIKH